MNRFHKMSAVIASAVAGFAGFASAQGVVDAETAMGAIETELLSLVALAIPVVAGIIVAVIGIKVLPILARWLMRAIRG